MPSNAAIRLPGSPVRASIPSSSPGRGAEVARVAPIRRRAQASPPRPLAIPARGAACTLTAPPRAALAAPPQCLTNLVANVFAGNPTTLPPAPCSDLDGDALTLILV